jgi:hypothetical protein
LDGSLVWLNVSLRFAVCTFVFFVVYYLLCDLDD